MRRQWSGKIILRDYMAYCVIPFFGEYKHDICRKISIEVGQQNNIFATVYFYA